MNSMKWTRLTLATTFVALAAAACGGNGSDPATPTGTPTATPTATATATPSATPTPAVELTLTNIHTVDGMPKSTLGKCIGFTVLGNDTLGVSFAPGTTVAMGPFTHMPVIFQDSTHLRVGDTDKGGKCFYTPFLAIDPGVYDVVVTSGTKSWTLAGGFEMGAPEFFDFGDLAKTRLWSADKFTDAGANVFEISYDVDIYKTNLTDVVRLYMHADFFNTGAAAILPETFLWNDRYKNSFLGRGGFAEIFPQPGIDYVVVRDSTGLGSPTSTYEVSVVGDELATTHPSDNCHGAPEITPNGYHVDYDVLTNNFDPDGGCSDSIYGNPVRSPGNDAAWTVTVPAGKELRVSGYDDHIDNVMYLLPMTDYVVTDSSGCPVRPTHCVAAASHYGGGNTDAIVYDNKSGVDEHFFLIHDSATVMTNNVGSFLMNVELFDAH